MRTTPPSLGEILAHYPDLRLAELDAPAIDWLKANATAVRLDAGEPWPIPEGRTFLLLHGQTEILVNGALYQQVTPPFVTGMLHAGNAHRDYQLVPRTALSGFLLSPSAVLELMHVAPPFATLVVLCMEAETEYLYSMEDLLQSHLKDWFPPQTGDLLPGPYTDKEAEVTCLVMEDPDHPLSGVLPRGLRPWPGRLGSRYLLCFNRFKAMQTMHPLGEKDGSPVTFDYLEALLFLPCRRGLRPGVYCSNILPDNYLAILLGREVYGLPKRFGMVRDFDAGPLTLLIDGKEVVRVDWTGSKTFASVEAYGDSFLQTLLQGEPYAGAAEQAADWFMQTFQQALATWLWPVLPVFANRRIPAMTRQRGVDWKIDHLVAIPFRTKVGTMQGLTGAKVTWKGDPPPFPVQGTCLGAFRLQTGMALLEPRVVRDNNALRWKIPPISWVAEGFYEVGSTVDWAWEVFQRKVSEALNRDTTTTP